MTQSIIFDHLSDHFHQKIYATHKGLIRLAIIDADLEELAPNRSLNILDIGAGGGQMSLLLAKKGHKITLLEPAAEMQEKAKALFKAEQCSAHFILGGIENLEQFLENSFDLILCHAVLEWLESPFMHLKTIYSLLKLDGLFSLAFYNQSGLILHNLIRGNLNAANAVYQKDKAHDEIHRANNANNAHQLSKNTLNIQKHKSLTPINPIDPSQMASELEFHQFSLIKESGIRVFHDFMAKANRDRLPLEQILTHELNYRTHPDFKRIARYVHWVSKKI